MEVRKLKIVQIENGFVHWDATRDVPDLDWAASHYSSEIKFVEAPDYVFEGWGFDETQDGDARFVKPIAPEGWIYNDSNGTFYPENDPPKEQEPQTSMSSVETLLDAIIS